MFLYFFIISFLYCLLPNTFTAFLWLLACIAGGVIMHQNKNLKAKVKHRAN